RGLPGRGDGDDPQGRARPGTLLHLPRLQRDGPAPEADRRVRDRPLGVLLAGHPAGRRRLRGTPPSPAQRGGMRMDRRDGMTGGWFVGDFEPTLYRTGEVEVAVKSYAAGDHEPRHHHRIATELTAIVAGRARMDGRELVPGDIVTLTPGQSSD